MSFISLLLKPKFVIVTSPSAKAPVLDQKYIGSHVPLCDLTIFAGATPLQRPISAGSLRQIMTLKISGMPSPKLIFRDAAS